MGSDKITKTGGKPTALAVGVSVNHGRVGRSINFFPYECVQDMGRRFIKV